MHCNTEPKIHMCRINYLFAHLDGCIQKSSEELVYYTNANVSVECLGSFILEG